MRSKTALSRWLAIFAAIVAVLSLGLERGLAAQDSSSAPPGTPVPFVPAHRQADRVAVLTVHGPIDELTLRSLERRMNAVKEAGFDGIVIDLDTPGGELYAARDIGNLLKTDAPINTVAWINPNAFSAGTLIALSCREIVVHPNASWGDCAPIMIDWNGLVALPPAERAKMEAPLRMDVVDSARRHGYDERLVEAFIAVGVELWMLENTQTGDRIFVNRDEYRAVFEEEPPTLLSSVTPPPNPGAAPVIPYYDPLPSPGAPAGVAGPFDNMTPEEIEQETRRQVELAQTRPPRPALTSADRNQWRLVSQVDSADRLLVVRAEQSIAYGLATQVISNDAELKAYFGASELVRLDESWSERLVRFLVSFWVRAILIAVFIIALFVEISMPGIGVFGALAAACLLVLLGAPYLVGMAEWWEVMLILVGLGLIAVELFIAPGFGIPGLLGGACLLVGTIGTFVSGSITTDKGQADMLTGVGVTFGGLVGAGIAIWLLSRYVYDTPFFRRFVLNATTEAPELGTSVASRDDASGAGGLMPGAIGIAHTDMRPAGRVMLDGRLIDAVTRGTYVPAGSRVRITHVDGFSVVVEEATE